MLIWYAAAPSPTTQFTPYPKTYLPEGVTSASCPTGLMFNASWPDGVGSGPNPNGYGDAMYVYALSID